MTSRRKEKTINRIIANGRYEIVSVLGSGGMGEVFLATDHNLDAKVVIKIPHAAMLRDSEFAARFQREIRSLVKLRHRSIVSIMDVGEQGGIPFAVMQYLEGGSLEDRLANGPQDEAALQQWLPDVSAALDFIHREGYVHRDIKPANILFDREGNAYVSDFGVAKVVGKGDSKQKASATMTGTGMVMGTPDYMAPELVMGESFDHRVDQYALAVTVFEFLSGRRPFEGPTPAAVMVKQCTTSAPSLKTACRRATPHAVSTVDRALSKAASARFESCSQFASAVLNRSQVNTPSGGSSVRSSTTIAAKSPGMFCPSCGATLRLGAKHAGKTIRCSGCQEKLKVADDLSRLSIADASSGRSAAPALKRTGSASTEARPPSAIHRNVSQQSRARSKPSRPSRWLVPAVVAGVTTLIVLAATVYFRGGAASDLDAQSPVGPKDVLSSQPFPIDVSEVNKPPIFEPVAEKDAMVGEPFTVTVVARDPDGPNEVLHFSLGALSPSGCRIDAVTGTLTWEVPPAQLARKYSIPIVVTDTEGATAESEVIVTINGLTEITNSVGMKLKLIAAGEFVMGSPADEADHQEAEGPQHRVQISKAFYMGMTEVTQGEWYSVMKTKPWGGKESVNEGDGYPAVYVSWDDAVEYCKQLSLKEGVTYRLPTEAEWEYACRGGKSTAYSFGNDPSQLSDYGWWGGLVGDGNTKTEQYAHIVGTKKANPYGLFDMHGNVFEWCQDVSDEKVYASRSGTTVDPLSTSGSEYRVLRGGSWSSVSGFVRSAYRLRLTPGVRSLDLGFRVVR